MAGASPTYNLKAVIRETGLSPATLRAWERRYGLVKPLRSPGGHRLYTHHEIEMLKWLVARQAEGLSISHAVEMWHSLENNEQDPLQAAHAQLAAAVGTSSGLEALRSDWISACMGYDELKAERALAQAFAIATPEVVCSEVLQKGLAEIGERWYAGSVSVQQEHFASALAMRRLNALFASAPSPTRPWRILAACPPGEQHVFILLMLAYLLRRQGWDVVYLGANVPLSRLDTALQLISPSLILSAAQTLNSAAALRDMAVYTTAQNVAMAYGGGIFNRIPALHERIPGHFLGDDLAVAPQLIERLVMQPAALPKTRPVPPETSELLEKFTSKEALIVATVAADPQLMRLEPGHLEEANANFTRDIVSALKLGEINFLDYSVGWLEGLLENHGLSPALAADYYATYRRSVQQHLGSQAAPVLNWLAKAEVECSR